MKTILTTICIIFFSKFGFGQWEHLDGPYGGTVYDLHIFETGEIWAATDGGVFSSQDSGATWERKNFVPLDQAVTNLIVDDDEIILVTAYFASLFPDDIFLEWRWHNDLMRSSDMGASWEKHFLYTTNRQDISAIPLYKIQNTLFLANFWQISKSIDYGKSWTAIDTGGGTIRATKFYEDEIVYQSFGSIFHSTDLGETWDTISTVDSWYDLIYFEKETLITYNSVNNTFRTSTDFGGSWEDYTISDDLWFENVVRGTSGKLYALGYETYVSENEGKTWELFTNGFREYPSSLKEISPQEILVSTYEGIFKTNDGGDNWSISNNGLLATEVEYLFDLSEERMIASTYNRVTFFSNDAGNNWEQIEELPPVTAAIGKNDSIFLVTVSGLFLSTDELQTIDTLSWRNFLFGKDIDIYNNRIYICEEERVRFTEDLGQTWKTVYHSSGNSNKPNSIEIVGDVFFLTTSGSILKSIDEGVTWKTISESGVSRKRFYQFDSTLVTSSHISNDFGTSWKRFFPKLSPATPESYPLIAPSGFIGKKNLLFANVPHNGFYFSKDFGRSWFPFNDGLENFRARSVLLVGNTLYGGTTNGGIWKRPIEINTVQGNVFYDENANGIFDSNESPVSTTILQTNDERTAVSTDKNGHFQIYPNQKGDTVFVKTKLSGAKIIPPYFVVKNETDSIDFAVTFPELINDLSLSVNAFNSFSPRRTNRIVLTVSNNGNTTLEPKVTFEIDSDITIERPLTFPIESPTDSSRIWNLPPLSPGEQVNIHVLVTLPSFSTWPDFPISAKVESAQIDQTPFDNLYDTLIPSSSFSHTSMSVDRFSLTTNEVATGVPLTYTVNFKNDNDTLVKDLTIISVPSLELDISTFKILGASHPVDWKIIEEGRSIEFSFKNIRLTTDWSEEFNNTGFLVFSIEPQRDLTAEKIISNKGSICLGNSSPEILSASTNINEVVSVFEIKKSTQQLKIYPNPATNHFILEKPFRELFSGILRIFDLSGKQIRKEKIEKTTLYQVNSEGIPKGVCFLQLTENEQVTTGKLFLE